MISRAVAGAPGVQQSGGTFVDGGGNVFAAPSGGQQPPPPPKDTTPPAVGVGSNRGNYRILMEPQR